VSRKIDASVNFFLQQEDTWMRLRECLLCVMNCLPCSKVLRRVGLDAACLAQKNMAAVMEVR
jgi:hypothetical protein